MKKIYISALLSLFISHLFSMNPIARPQQRRISLANPLIRPGHLIQRTNEPLALKEIAAESFIQRSVMPILKMEMSNFSSVQEKINALLKNAPKDVLNQIEKLFYSSFKSEIAHLFLKKPFIEFQPHNDDYFIAQIAFDPSNRYCATMSKHTMYESKKSILNFYSFPDFDPLPLPKISHQCSAIKYSPQGRFLELYEQGSFGETTLLDTLHDFYPYTFNQETLATAFNNEENIMFAIGKDKDFARNQKCTLTMWDLETHQIIPTDFILPDNISRISPQGNCIIATTRNPQDPRRDLYEIILLSVQEKKPTMTRIDASGFRMNDGACSFALHLPNTLLAISSYNDIYVWNFSTNSFVAHFEHDDIVNNITFNPSGTMLASASNDWTARLWNIVTPKEINLHTTESRHIVTDVAFHPQQNVLFSADSALRMWDLTKEMATQLGATEDISAGSEAKIIMNTDGTFFTIEEESHVWHMPTSEQLTFEQLIWLYGACWAQKNLKAVALENYIFGLENQIDKVFADKSDRVKNHLRKLIE